MDTVPALTNFANMILFEAGKKVWHIAIFTIVPLLQIYVKEQCLENTASILLPDNLLLEGGTQSACVAYISFTVLRGNACFRPF